jgi:DNA-binding MarR family transcriptional regulator
VPGFGQAVGFLLSQLGYVVARQFRTVMAEVELEPRQFALMRAIAAHQGQSQNHLVDLLRIPASSMVALIDHLEERGLVERRIHPADRRSRTVHVTDVGHALLARATSMAMALEQRICAGLSPEARQSLIERLQQVGRNLDVIEGVHPDLIAGHDARSWTDEEPGVGAPAGTKQ